MARETVQGEEQFNCKYYLWKCLFPCQDAFEECTTKAEHCNGKSYIKNLYTRLYLQISLHVPA